jgi:hypothetical protein
MPLTLRNSFALLNGRAAMIRSAIAGPIPGMFSNSADETELMSSLWLGGSLSPFLPFGWFRSAASFVDPVFRGKKNRRTDRKVPHPLSVIEPSSGRS